MFLWTHNNYKKKAQAKKRDTQKDNTFHFRTHGKHIQNKNSLTQIHETTISNSSFQKKKEKMTSGKINYPLKHYI